MVDMCEHSGLAATHLKRLMLKMVAIAIEPYPRPSSQREEKPTALRDGKNTYVFFQPL
jgi:hypothetical protein